MSERKIIDMLMDEACNDPVVLEDCDGKETAFEQIAVIPFDGALYAILAEKSKFDRGELEDCAIVVWVDEENDALLEVTDSEEGGEVFAIYERMLAEAEE